MKRIFLLLLIAISFSACAPSCFMRTHDVGWAAIQLRDDLSYDQAFNDVIDVVAKRLQMDMISKDGDYARLQWNHI